MAFKKKLYIQSGRLHLDHQLRKLITIPKKHPLPKEAPPYKKRGKKHYCQHQHSIIFLLLLLSYTSSFLSYYQAGHHHGLCAMTLRVAALNNNSLPWPKANLNLDLKSRNWTKVDCSCNPTHNLLDRVSHLQANLYRGKLHHIRIGGLGTITQWPK